MLLTRGKGTARKRMEEVEEGAEKEAQHGSPEKDEDGPAGDQLRVGHLRMQFHGSEYVGIDVVFNLLGVFADGVDEGVVESVGDGLDDARGDVVFVVVAVGLHVLQFEFEFLLE